MSLAPPTRRGGNPATTTTSGASRKLNYGGVVSDGGGVSGKRVTKPGRRENDGASWELRARNLGGASNSSTPQPRRRKQGGWVSELEGISEKEVDVQEVRVRREVNTGMLGNRRIRGFHVIDLQGKRKLLSRRELLLAKRERKPARIRNSPEKAFPLANLEAYLKERGPSALVKESLGFSPSSRPLQYLHNSSASFQNQQLVYVRDCPSNLSESQARRKPKLLVRAYGSANEVDEVVDTDDTHSERSGCGMPWHWPSSSSQRMKSHDHNIESSATYLPAVNNKRAGRRNRMMSYKYSSERSVSSFDSDTDTIPLMTEPEPFHDYSDDPAGSSMDLGSESRLNHNSKKSTRFKDGILANLPAQGQEVVVRKQKGPGGSKHRSLSQKYRPKSFKDLIGQNMVVESLSNAILRAKIAPVYLFHGPRGTGKTTAAKIFTNAMNCLTVEELRPCGLCKECTAFNTGQNYDVKQVDAAGNNDVESMRLLLKHVSLPPSSSRYKVFIVDDCHTLTAEAWNALLKSLEEPPSYVVFILITTDLELLPRTAISRCQKFLFTRVKDADIVLRLRKVALQERVEIELEALQFIASRSDGSFRDAENMLDQLSLLGNKVTLATVQEMVGLIPDEKLTKLLELALAGNSVSTVNAIRELMESGVEPLALTSQLATLITDILVGKNRVSENTAMRVKKEEEERLKQVLKILSEAEKQLRSCSDRTTWLTAAFLQFAPKESCHQPSLSQGTSVTQSPITLVDTSKKEMLDPDFTTRLSWGGDEKWDSRSLSRKDYTGSLQGGSKLDGGQQKQMDNCGHHFSGPFGDNRIHPCDLSPQSRSSIPERQSVGYASPGNGRTAQRKGSTMSPSTVDSIWKKVLQGSRSNSLKQLLHGKGKLVSLSVTEAFAVAYVEFGHPEHKAMAERARLSIANAFQLALGCPVEVEISLSSLAGDINFVGRDNNYSTQQNAEQHGTKDVELPQERRTMKGESFGNLPPANPSTLHHSLERRRSRQSFEIEVRSHSTRSTNVSYMRDSDSHRSKDLSHHHAINSHDGERLRSSSKHMQGQEGQEDGQDCHVKDHVQEKEEGVLEPSMPFQGNGSDNDDAYCSDSEQHPDRDAPGALCWKGVRTNENKGRHQMRRRRRKGRFLLRLVPCAKGGGRR
eukprot:c24136_g1_i1 orf=399-3839(-)